MDSHIIPNAPCMEYLPTFIQKFKPNVGIYSTHGASWASLSAFCQQTLKVCHRKATRASQKNTHLQLLTCLSPLIQAISHCLGGRDLVTKFMAGESWEHMKDDVDKMNYPLF